MMTTYPLHIIEEYKSGIALTALAKKYNIYWAKLRLFLKEHGLEIRGRKKHQLNKDYFKNLDSNEKAYFLGLLWADGSIFKFRKTDSFLGKVNINLVEEDSYLLEAMRVAIQHEGELHHIKKDGNRQNQKKLQIADKDFAKCVENLGMKPNKTYDGGVPIINEELMAAFLLGYFDGDGCFTSWENQKRKERKCLFSLSTHPDTALLFKEFLSKNGISSYFHKPKDKPIYVLYISGNIQCAKFFNLIYSVKNLIPIYLQRKYLKSKYFLEKYGALTKVKFNIPSGISCDGIQKWGENNLTGQQLLDFRTEWAEIQSRENIIPSVTSSERFLPNAPNKPV